MTNKTIRMILVIMAISLIVAVTLLKTNDGISILIFFIDTCLLSICSIFLNVEDD